MPKTLQPEFGLDPLSGIRDPGSMPYYMKRGIASFIWKENGEHAKDPTPDMARKQFMRAYKIIGASLVNNGFMYRPDGRQGRLDLTGQGVDKQRKLMIAKTKKERERLDRSKVAVKYLDALLVKLKADLESGVEETT